MNAQLKTMSQYLDKVGDKVGLISGGGKGVAADSTIRDLQTVLDAIKKINEESLKMQAGKQQTPASVRELVSLYGQLSAAESKYLSADAKGHTTEADIWGKRADAIRESIKQLEAANPALKENTQVMEAKRKAEEDAAIAMERHKAAIDKVADAQAKQNTPAKQAAEIYKDLKTSIKDYNDAMKAGNTEGAQAFSEKIETLRGRLEELKATFSQMKPEDAGYSEMADNINRAETALAKFNQEANNSNSALTAMGTTTSQVGDRMMSWLTRILVYRGLRKMWTEAKEFASDYYATLNEIQVVTMKSDQQVQTMASNFGSLSQELRVPLTDIASAATIFYRQGLNDEQVNERLEAITKFSKISGTSVEDASQYFTAVLNSFDELEGNAQRVSDVFTYIGDNAATSGEEIATAMQRAAATAQAAGMGFEFLSSAIATVSANTRQSAETIGTAFNSMMARLHSIRTTGYNQEDETKVNDVAKALKTVGIELMNSEGEWQDFDKILTTLSKKWTTLTDKQQSYIATTLAGVRAQNYFLSLMNDMSKGLEGGSTMWELYNGAMEAAGITNQKYEVYLDGITAAQDRLTAAMQNFYDLIGSGNFFTNFYNQLAGIVEGFNSVTKAVGGLNISVPIAIAGIAMIAQAIKSLITSFASGEVMAAVLAHPFIAMAAAAVAAIGVVTLFAGAMTTVQDTYSQNVSAIDKQLGELKTSLSDTQKEQQNWLDKASDLESLKDKYIELASNTQRSAEQNAELQEVLSQISSAAPGVVGAVGEITSAYSTQESVVNGLNAAIRENMELARQQGMYDAKSTGYQQLAETAASIRGNNDVLSRRQVYVDRFRNWKEPGTLGNEREAFTEFIEGIVEDAVMAASEGTLGGRGYDPLGRHRRKAFTDLASEWGIEAAPGASEEAIIAALYDAYIGQDLNISKNQNQVAEYYNTAKQFMDFFRNDQGLSDNLIQAAEARINPFLSDLEQISTNTGLPKYMSLQPAGWLNVFSQIESAWQDYQDIQKLINTDVQLNNYDAKVLETRKAYNEAVEQGKTAEEIQTAADNYNEAVRTFNDRYKEVSGLERGVYDEITADLTNAGKAAETAAENVGSINEEIERAKKVRQARESGFASQADDLSIAAGLDGRKFNRTKFVSAARELERTAPDIFAAMGGKDEESAFGKLLKNAESTAVISESIFADVWKQVQEGWKASAESAKEYTDAANEAATAGGDQTVTEQLVDALETGGYQALVERWASLPEDLAAQWKQGHADLYEMLFGGEEGVDPEEAITKLNEILDGTTEHFGTLAEAISNTGSSSQETVNAIDALMEYISQAENVDQLAGSWEKLTKEQQKALQALGVDKKQFDGLKEGSKALKDFQNNLRRLKIQNLEKMGKVLSGTSDAYDSLVAGTKEYTKFLPTLNQQINKTKQMQDAYDTVVDKSKEGTDEYTEALNTLASATGLTAEQLQTSGGMAQALAQLDGQAEITWGTIEALAGTLLSMSGITFDPSMISNGYLALGDSAVGAAGQVMELVNAALSLLGASISFTPDGKGGGKFNVTGVKGNGSKSSKSTKGGGGGGGGGGGKDKDTFSSRLKQLEQQMSRSVDKYKDMLDRLSLYESRFEDQGELTNVLRVLEQRRQVLIEQADAYNQILKDMPNLIQQAKNELGKYGAGTEEYTTALSDLQNLEDAYASYTSELIKNRTEQLQNADAIKETREAIVKLEGSLRNTIQSVIMERDEREAASLSARVDMDNEILAAIQERYEKERDEIQETTDLRIKALDKETDALSDALDKRRELAEAEDKEAKLAELQNQYARIVADPTRIKEANEIAKKISDLQQEMAWDAAEREVEAQQKAIDQQQESLEDYQSFIDKYYDALIEDPRNFIDEYNELLSKSDAEIINWLSRNSDSYLKATDAAREQLAKGWQDTMDELRMYTRTVWDEVEAIMNLGDEGILNFLINNSQEFREANTFDQADMIYEWKEMLEDWHSAYKDTFQNLDYLDFTNSVYDWVTYLISEAKAKGGGGGGGGGTPNWTPGQKSVAEAGNKTMISGAIEAATQTLFGDTLSSIGSQIPTWIVSAINNKGNTISAEIMATTEKNAIEMFKQKKAASGPFSNIRASKKYDMGGILNYTGPAWVDGTKERPERILSAHQTQAFDTLVDWLTTPRINVPGLSAGMGPTLQGAGSAVTFGDINIEVESLDSDTDIDNLADRLMDAINERMLRGMAVGGGITSGF